MTEPQAAGVTEKPRPYTLVAELSYRCPLRCLYCSNPTTSKTPYQELDTATWQDVFRQASALGAVQLHLSGGEPLIREDLEELVASARGHGFYVNLITSGVPLERARLERLQAAGLDALQLSFQGTNSELNAWVAGKDYLEQKLRVAGWVKALGLPLTVNVVLHRKNIDHVAEYVALAEELGALRVELANTQYLGFALTNRDSLLPTLEQLTAARDVAKAARERLAGKMEVLFVLPDYHRDRPRACMNGWGRQFLLVNPAGVPLPCHQATSIEGLSFLDVKEASLEFIWNESPAFAAFRGEEWMAEPCRTCERRTVDFGGCRCQAFQLLGDAAATDPACGLSPRHDVVVQARVRATAIASDEESAGPVRYRSLPVYER